jgi:flagellar biosynthesis/type III secretory pathway M-ring protein FliF/YscJ
MKFLDKIRERPIRDRKIILWSILIFVGLIFIILLLYIFSKELNNLQKSDLKEKINFPAQENLPNFEGPENVEEMEKELEEFKRAIEELEEAEKENNEQ